MTSGSNETLPKTVGEVGEVTKSYTLNNAFTIKFTPGKLKPSSHLTWIFLARFQTPNFFANSFPTTGALAAQSTIASTSSTAS